MYYYRYCINGLGNDIVMKALHILDSDTDSIEVYHTHPLAILLILTSLIYYRIKWPTYWARLNIMNILYCYRK